MINLTITLRWSIEWGPDIRSVSIYKRLVGPLKESNNLLLLVCTHSLHLLVVLSRAFGKSVCDPCVYPFGGNCRNSLRRSTGTICRFISDKNRSRGWNLPPKKKKKREKNCLGELEILIFGIKEYKVGSKKVLIINSHQKSIKDTKQ